MGRTATIAGSRGPHDQGLPLARLTLLDSLLRATDRAGCASTTLAWLADHAGCESSLCLATSAGGDRLELLASCAPEAADGPFAVELGPATDPLVLALASSEPVWFGGSATRRPRTPLGDLPFWSVPLRFAEGEANGLLLLGCRRRGGLLLEVAVEAAELLANRLAALAWRDNASHRRKGQRHVQWLQGVLEAVSDPILLTDADGRILIANRSAEELLTADEEASPGRRRAVGLNNMLFSASLFTTSEATGNDNRRELLLVDPADGQDLLFELLIHPLPIRDGEEGVVSVLRNVTDLHRAGEELEQNYWRLRAAEARTRAERDRLDLVLNSVFDPILVTDPAGNIVMTNPPAERLLTAAGRRGEEIVRRVRSNDAVITSFVSRLFAGQSSGQRAELSLSDPDSGETVPMEAFSARIVSDQGEDTAVVTVLHDLTEAKERAELYATVKRHSEELEERVREATAELVGQNELLRRQALELEEASAMKSLFLANVSHELRTPLNAIIGYTSLLVDGVAGAINPRQQEKLERLESNAQHLLAIINDLLDLSRIEAGKMPVECEELMLAELVDEVMAEVDPLVPKRDLEVQRHVPAGMPPLHSDRQKIKQILINLLSNALKFTPAGEVTVEARHDAERDEVTVAVADTGIGIAAENLEKIFETYGQTGSSHFRAHRGTGLGLSISRRLAQLLGGDLEVESVEGEGSTFTVTLPRLVTTRGAR